MIDIDSRYLGKLSLLVSISSKTENILQQLKLISYFRNKSAPNNGGRSIFHK